MHKILHHLGSLITPKRSMWIGCRVHRFLRCHDRCGAPVVRDSGMQYCGALHGRLMVGFYIQPVTFVIFLCLKPVQLKRYRGFSVFFRWSDSTIQSNIESRSNCRKLKVDHPNLVMACFLPMLGDGTNSLSVFSYHSLRPLLGSYREHPGLQYRLGGRQK